MVINRSGFMDVCFSLDKTYIVGATDKRTFILDTTTDKKIVKLPYGAGGQFNASGSRLFLVKQNGELVLYDLEQKIEIQKQKLPNNQVVVDSRFCYFDDNTVYFLAEDNAPVQETNRWTFLKYIIEEDRFDVLFETSAPFRVLGRWKEYLVIRKSVVDEKDRVLETLEFYKDSIKEKTLSLGEVTEARILDGKIYAVRDREKDIRIFEYDENLTRRNAFALDVIGQLMFEDAFALNERYVAFAFFQGRKRLVRVYDIQTKTPVFEKNIRYFMNLNLCGNKLYVGAMNKLYMFPLDK